MRGRASRGTGGWPLLCLLAAVSFLPDKSGILCASPPLVLPHATPYPQPPSKTTSARAALRVDPYQEPPDSGMNRIPWDVLLFNPHHPNKTSG